MRLIKTLNWLYFKSLTIVTTSNNETGVNNMIVRLSRDKNGTKRQKELLGWY